MTELISKEEQKVRDAGKTVMQNLKITLRLKDILLMLIVIPLLGYLMLSITNIEITYSWKIRAVAAVSYIAIAGITQYIMLKINKIKSKDDFSKLPRQFITYCYNTKKSSLSKIILIPNCIYSLSFLILCLGINNELKSLFYWLFVVSICLSIVDIYRLIRTEESIQ